MHDIVIRGGTIIDGTGKAAFCGDVAIAEGRITEVGGKQGPARREIDADGLVVTPGWVDVHTHYDGQAMWDPLLAPSCWHGVTTVMFGNCGVGFAPVKKHHRQALMDLMEGVEEIPNPVLAAGLNWEWETFPDFMDALERRERVIDIAAQVAHLPMRVYVMGDRAVRREPATADDIAEMRRITVEALRAGAFGFTTSRTDSHKTPDGELVPSRDADDQELLGIGSALGEVGSGAFGMNSDFDDEEYELRWMRKQAKETGRPVWFLLTDRFEDPQRWRRLMKAVHAARSEGLPLAAQIAGRPIGVMMGIGTALNPFTVRPSYKALENLPDRGAAQAVARSRAAAEDSRRKAFRRRGRESSPSSVSSSPAAGTSSSPWTTHRITNRIRKRALPRSLRAPRHTPDEVAYDYIIEREPVSVLSGGELRDGRPRADPRDAQRPGLPARLERRRRALHLDRGFRPAEFHAGALGSRPPPRAAVAPRASGQAANQRNRRLLRSVGSRPARAGLARRREPHRLRPSATAQAGARARHAGRRPAFRATGRGISGNACGRHSHLRARRAYRRDAGAPRTSRP